jgi:carboxylesterase type B
MRQRLALLAAVSVMAGMVVSAAARVSSQGNTNPSAVITLPGQGTISGFYDETNNLLTWLGVPFAADTSGSNRFLPPQSRAAWTGTLDTTEFGPGCPSLHHNPDVANVTSEDCLNMNIYVPAGASGKLSTYVWIYGGSFAEGDNRGAFGLYDGAYMASHHNVIVVEPNYRLGALGYARFRNTAAVGNEGIMDQDFALRWVQKYISLFGGDPSQVTIMGESAGAMSVGIHLTRPGSRGLFSRAIMESNFAGYVYRNASGADDFGDTVCQNVAGCWQSGACSLSCMQAADYDDVRKAWDKASGNVIDFILSDWGHFADAILGFTPNVDGTFITELPLAAIVSGSPNFQSDVPVLLGTNGFEGQTFIYSATTDVLPTWLLDIAYPVLLGGSDNAKQIESQPRYSPSSYSDAKEQLSNVVTDAWFRCASEIFADHAQTGWVYRYNHTFSHSEVFGEFGLPTICEKVACHASELPFVWHNDVPSLNATFSPQELVLTGQMDAYWGSFIRGGDPNTYSAPGSIHWPQWNTTTKQNILFDTPASFIEDSLEMCGFWSGLKGFGFW